MTDEEKRIAKAYARKGASFMFIPSSYLKNLIINNHPMTKNINHYLKIFILEGKAIRLNPSMIEKYCDNQLSVYNSWLLDHGDIKVEPARMEIK